MDESFVCVDIVCDQKLLCDDGLYVFEVVVFIPFNVDGPSFFIMPTVVVGQDMCDIFNWRDVHLSDSVDPVFLSPLEEVIKHQFYFIELELPGPAEPKKVPVVVPWVLDTHLFSDVVSQLSKDDLLLCRKVINVPGTFLFFHIYY